MNRQGLPTTPECRARGAARAAYRCAELGAVQSSELAERARGAQQPLRPSGLAPGPRRAAAA